MTTPLFEVVQAMEDALLRARVLGQALDAAGGSEPPAWVYVYTRQIEDLDAAFTKVYEAAVAANWGAATP
jgi:hypothetical protein